ncbi:electron transfer flavoprotein subunit beta/FixA family protein [Trinickia sp. EG282A]|uniref:electron transfer flavoprotein subunit beta/FixA family protein n=1 Tax=Trinickia sp. EG282A TaxID=3237013 RepID=UPI0034D2DB57
MSATARLGRIAVLVSVGKHRVSAASCYSRNDALALEIGRRLARAHDAALDVLHAGDAADPALQDYLALGAERIEVLECREGDDASEALARRLRGTSLVLTGTRAEGAYDSGMLPYRLAAELGYALIDSALEIAIEGERATVTQFMPKGVRRRVQAALPAVVAVHPQASAQPRYAYARIPDGAIVPEAKPVRRDIEAAEWRVAPAQRKPMKLVAAEKRSGHARMLMATTTESRGGNVVIEGTSVEKAQVILDYLREHRLVDY